MATVWKSLRREQSESNRTFSHSTKTKLMNNKEFINELSTQTGLSAKDAASYSALLVSNLSQQLAEEDNVNITGFGLFEVKRKLERIIINPASKQRMLVPPKIVVGFKPAPTLKERINQKNTK